MPDRKNSLICATVVIALTALVLSAGCKTNSEAIGSYAAANQNDCLPNVSLTDQNGRRISLASLKGKPVLANFIYTSCTGPCPMLTEKFAAVAKELGPKLGQSVELVSITLDPEHDQVAQLKAYVDSHGADRAGWLFLTGTPAEIEQVLSAFNIRREREADGSVTHMVTSFLIGPDGHQVRQYNGFRVTPQTVASDVNGLLAGTS